MKQLKSTPLIYLIFVVYTAKQIPVAKKTTYFKQITMIEPLELANNLFRSIWFYFHLSQDFLGNVEQSPSDENKVMVFNVAKAVVVNILKNRDVYGFIYEIIYTRSPKLNLDILHEINLVIKSFTEDEDPFSGFITLCAICSDFIVFLRSKGNYLNVNRQKLLELWIDIYVNNFQQQISESGGLQALSTVAYKQAGNYPCQALQDFTKKYCDSDSFYCNVIVPRQFLTEVYAKYDRDIILYFKS